MNEIAPGRYRHYKGHEYSVLGAARHSETLEELVVYRQEYGERGLWVRPRQMFLETVNVDGQELPRFQRLGPHAESGPDVRSLFRDLPLPLNEEVVHTILTAADVRIERIVAQGHASPADFWYDQDEHEWVLVLKGAARVQFAGAIVAMAPGDCINIPAHTRHRVEWTAPNEPTIWLAVYYGDPP